MHYMGSKTNHAAAILKIATAGRKPGQAWCEAFVGGGNVICRVPHEQGPRIGNDINWRVIALLDAVGNKNWSPPETMTEDEYNQIKFNRDNHPPELVAFAATAATFGCNWFGQWVDANRYRQGRDAVMRDAPGLRGAKFISGRYEDFTAHIPPESIVYCDPPYVGADESNARGYKAAKTDIEVGQDLSLNAWNRVAFWKWADALVDAGHSVFVSEYSGAPAHVYDGRTPELKAERDALLAQAKITDKDPKAANREALRAQLADVDRRIKDERERLAARWEVLWSKEVTADFHPGRKAGVRDGKTEIEKLFHRKA